MNLVVLSKPGFCTESKVALVIAAILETSWCPSILAASTPLRWGQLIRKLKGD